ncbi:MAG: serine/threonine-protein kinase [Myxococcota bacterium]
MSETPQGHDRALWETVAAVAQTQGANPGSTMGRRAGSLDSGGRAVLGAFEQSESPRADAGLEMGEVLGEGGMGIVRVATQRTMGREVAVKAVRKPLRRPGPTLKLLQEAWTAGRLEHPNIVPVYDIATGDEGEPLIVQKRIEGQSWASVLRDPEGARRRYDIDDPLDWNLRVLMQVCNAIHFAHDRGILHLDVKPENVMIGDHGEVYVVDWGIALASRDDTSGRLPLAAKHKGVIGTPHYMAPEMLEGDGSKLDERTDVYLLGATLFEALEGGPPHRADTVMAAFHASMHEEPGVSESVPPELAGVCRRALAKDPGDRFGSAEELRRAVQDFLRHRDSDRMASAAASGLRRLRDAADPTSDVKRHETFARVRFGFEQALASWPDNETARIGLAESFALVIAAELEHGDPEVAASLAAQAPSVSGELRRRVDEAVRRRQAGRDELAQHRIEEDLDIGKRTRVFVFAVMGVTWTAMPLIGANIDMGDPAREYRLVTLASVVAIVLVLALGYWARDSLSRTRLNRLTMVGVAAALTGQVLLLIAARTLGLPPDKAVPLAPLTWTLGAAIPAVVVDRRIWLVVANFAVSLLLGASYVEYRWYILSASSFVSVLLAALLWWPLGSGAAESES